MIIRIEKYPVSLTIGCYPQEKLQVNNLLVSLMLDIGPWVQADCLDQTVDYAQVIEVIDNTLQGREINLVETAVNCLGLSLLEHFPGLKAVEVKAIKCVIPDGKARGAEISVEERFTR